MKNKTDFLDPDYPEFNKIRFEQRRNHYDKMIKWLVFVNILAWAGVTYVVIKWLSV